MLGGVRGRLTGLLADDDYRRIWLVGIWSGVSRWLEMLVVGVYAFQTTGSPVLVTLLVTLRLLPLALFGSIIGALADRASPRLYLIAGMASGALVSAVVSALFLAGEAEYWMIAVATFLSGIIWTTDMPLRRRLLGDIAGHERLVVALSFDSASSNATRMIGPLVGGLVYQSLGAGGAFAVATVLYAVSAAQTLRVTFASGPVDDGKPLSGLATDLAAAVRLAITNRDILRLMLVTIVFNVWALPFLSIIPVLGSEQLDLRAGWIGALAALEGAGAFIGALVLSVTAQPAHFRRLYYFGTAFYLFCVFLAGWATGITTMTMVVLGVGLGAAAFSSIQSALIYSVAPPQMRSRLLGLLTICIGAGVLGMLNIGLMAEWYGVADAVRIVAVEGTVFLFLIAINWSQLWARR